MKKIIGTNHDLCVGCNRCIKECPLEMANVAYLDESGSIKVKIDNEKCIACGMCISVCQHRARYYEDDTGLFFSDLSRKVPISIIIAPAIKTNFHNWKNLLTYLRNIGVNKIYDVSLGADICVWAHIRHIQKSAPKSLITQPCPAIVSYCELYQHKLLDNLSPIHSPMACTAVYMRQYEGISDRIAAISPCIGKANEFESIRTIQYNVTFAKLREYIEENNIRLPVVETGFDHYDSGLGSIFSMPGGLKENVEFFLGKSLRIDKSEGHRVYKDLAAFSSVSKNLLPDIYDVLNCEKGCNSGSGCGQENSVFAIDTMMDNCRKSAFKKPDRDYFQALYNGYDNMLNLAHFLRLYRKENIRLPRATETDIQKAFQLLGKNDELTQNYNCGACGAESCYEMAKRVALKVNIPENCVLKARDDANAEHKKNLKAYQENLRYTTIIDNSFEIVTKSTAEIAEYIEGLKANIFEYSKMAKEIEDIASMINIISINASIEAVRAGVHGKAFAVVADEIRGLAAKSKEAVSTAENLFEQSNSIAQIMYRSVNSIQNAIILCAK